MLKRVVQDLSPGVALRSAKEMVSGSSQYHNQHWLLHPKYPYYLLTVMFLVQSLLSGGRAQPAAENDMPPILGLVGLVYVIGSASLSCVCLAGAWPLIIKSARIYGILRLFYHRSPVMSIGVDRWVFFFYLTTLTGVIEPLITAAQGKRSQPSEIINTVGPIFCAFFNAACQSPQSIVLLTTVSIRKILRSALKATNIPSAPQIYKISSGVLSAATAIAAASPFLLKHVVKSIRIITNKGDWLTESQKLANIAVIVFSILSIIIPPELGKKPPRPTRQHQD
uniref:Uncharacterized protein n=1 Tax=Rhodosorus marinus TaxID=101924 RepID=A0A7S2ZCD3_9RHOD|mmetsp:Transcript_14469/g.58603  ORF Transcript_14469/g.58603 Transcript_14469/m.58603 type:complete len:281 (+) Transcript_14469:1540-2382(+)